MLDKPIAYTYEADYHCVDCTRRRFFTTAMMHTETMKRYHENVDVNGVAIDAKDNDGNTIGALLSTMELPTDLQDRHGGQSVIACSDCRAIIATRDKSLEEGAHNHD